MLIDWFTVTAQVVNFLVLVWLLKRYLYQPILKAIDAREKDLASRREEMIEEKKRAIQEVEETRRERESFERHRINLLNDAREEAKAEKAHLLEEINQEADASREARFKELSEEISSCRGDWVEMVRLGVIEGTRKLVSELASVGLEEALVDSFIDRLRELPVSDQKDGSALKGPIRLRTTFPLSSILQERVRTELKGRFLGTESISFETDPKMILGIELVTDGKKLGWTANGYLSDFEAKLKAGNRGSQK